MARDLLGKTLASDIGGDFVSGVIVETEAYLGVRDAASHAWQGRRNQLHHGVWAPAGTWYVYRSYGIHWCLNLTAPTSDDGAAVLIRAVRPTLGLDVMRRRRGRDWPDVRLADGPGKVGQAFGISAEHDGMIPSPAALLRIEDADMRDARGTVLVTPRIGITRAADWPLRFVLTP